MDPMPETTALYERIQAARAARPHNLPAESAPFVGRATELTQVLNLLTNPDCRVVTIVGFGVWQDASGRRSRASSQSGTGYPLSEWRRLR